MDSSSRLDSVDTDPSAVAIAQRHLGSDKRVTFYLTDGARFVLEAPTSHFDLIYADAWPGKFTHLDEALARLRPGGIYLIDDLLHQPNWPDGHEPKVRALIESLEGRSGEFASVKLSWASGLMLVVRKTFTG
jgi:predicted O-methyltransferase YrrM